MLCHRVVCVLLYRWPGVLVKGERFASHRRVGSLLQAARVHARRGVDELVLLDVEATAEGREPDYALVQQVTEGCFVPVAVGGGVKTAEHVKGLLRAGADKVVIGAAARSDPPMLRSLAERFGCQCLTVAIDCFADEEWLRCRRSASDVVAAGAGEILLTDAQRDGLLTGYNLGLCRTVRQVVDVPLVLAGGAGTYQHFAEGLDAGADAVAAGAMWQFTEQTPAEAARYLVVRGYRVRLPVEQQEEIVV